MFHLIIDSFFRIVLAFLLVAGAMMFVRWVTFGGLTELKKKLRIFFWRQDRRRDFENHHPGIKLRH